MASLRMGEGAVGPAASPPAGVGVGSLRPCPLRDMPEVSGDQDTLSRVQGAAQGVVSGGYLGRPVRGDGAEASFQAARHSARVMAWILDCLFASAFEPRPRRGELGPPSREGWSAWPGAAWGCSPSWEPWGLAGRPLASLPPGF